MKKTACILFAAIMFLSLAACKGKDAPTPTDRPAGVTAEPGSTEAAVRPTLDPARQAFDPYTDFDNRNGGLIACAMLEAEDAYYLYANGYIMYYDCIAGEGGCLCPRPECLHDEQYNNKACNANASINNLPSLTIYEGQLWWVGYTDVRHWGIFRMDLDGANRRMIREFEITGEFQGMNCWFFHRGRLYWSSLSQKIVQGNGYNRAAFCYMELDDFEPHLLCERLSLMMPQPTIRFLGDSAYFFVAYDGVDPENTIVPDPEVDEAGYLEWAKNNHMKFEILRWDPYMDEPETVYLDEDDKNFRTFNDYYIDSDGTIYFRGSELEDPEREYDEDENRYITSIYRVNADGSSEKHIELTDESGNHYSLLAMSSGVIVAADMRWVRKAGYDIRAVWVLTFEGETVFRGELPLSCLEKYDGPDYKQKNPLSTHELIIEGCWGTRNELLICFNTSFDDTGMEHGCSDYYDFVKYEITPDGFIEIPMAACRDHYWDE